MNFEWESEEDKMRRYMAMPARKKLELLYELQRFTRKYMTKSGRKYRALVKKLEK
jgi:hypothetical protein